MNEIFHRTSIRKYQDKPVEDEKIEKMLQAAMAAPSAGNQQPWEFYVVKNKSTLEKLSQTSPYAGCAASVENLLLEADSLGLGAVWLGIAPLKERMEAVRTILNIPENLDVFAIIPCGYPEAVHAQQNRFDEQRIHYVL